MTRREFLAKSAAVTAAATVPNAFAFTQASATIKVGLIGCGGRGSGAANDCFSSSPGVELWAMGDAFEDRLKSSQNNLKGALKDSYKVTPERSFVGFDAYQGVINSGVDLVILATPPGFRPMHLQAAIDAGKHVFMEKPVAVDGPGIRTVLQASSDADHKGLAIVCGTQRRHETTYLEAMKRIEDGAIGEIVAASCYWNQAGLWMHPRKAEWSDVEWQMRNWLYFTWLSGDHIVEQHVHNIDAVNWAMGGYPVKAIALGGRQARVDPAYGHIFDHFAVEFEYANGVKCHSYSRQQEGTASRVSEHLVGTKGTSNGNTWIKGENAWRFEGENPNPYVLEHKNLIASIRAGKPLNEGYRIAESTMTAILGRTAAYTGKEVTRDQILGSKASIVPDHLEWGTLAVAPVPMPGQTQFE